MRTEKTRKWIGSALISFLVALTLTILLDLAVALFDIGAAWQIRALTMGQFAAAFGICFLVSFAVSLLAGKTWNVVAGGISAALWVILAAGILCWQDVGKDTVYQPVDNGKEALYGNQRVMLLVPHQDDDINVLGGVLEEYVKYGSEVYVVFSTNGDLQGIGEIRLQEAVDVLGYAGIPEENVIFLGYGDRWDPDGPHIYNAEPGVQIQSFIGRTETYGLADHPAYHDGNAYTSDNFLSDLESLILEYRPDVLYCIDYDHHIDHRSLMLGFEKAMGRILQSQTVYRPQVFKGYAYGTAWEGPADFHAENLLATQDIFTESYGQKPAVYRWEDRVRLPIHGENLSRSVTHANAYKTLAKYTSQYAGIKAIRIFNSDKVFWQRRTDSLCYDAVIRTSSGSAALLNDFMLLDSVDLTDENRMPYDGVWIPAAEDTGKKAHVAFSGVEAVESIVLYDHPDPEINVLNAVILFDDGTSLETGALDPNGAATMVSVQKPAVSSFTVILTECQGNAGLTEVEAYRNQPVSDLSFVKLTDGTGNFVYDYWINASGRQEFLLYTSGKAPEATAENYLVRCSGEGCSAVWKNDRIVVECPSGKRCTVEVSATNGKFGDTVVVRNPAAAERAWKMSWLDLETWIIGLSEEHLLQEKLVVCRLYIKLPQKLNAIFS